MLDRDDELRTQIIIDVNEAIKPIEELIDTTERLKTSLSGITSAGSSTSSISSSTSGTIGDITKLKTALTGTLKLGASYVALKKMFSTATDFASEYFDKIASQNMLQTRIKNLTDEYGNLISESSNYYDRAIAFEEELASKIYATTSELAEYQSKFYSLYQNQGVAEDVAYFLSEQLTKASYDLSSLTNTDAETMAEALFSGIVGQTKSLRSNLGVDLSESSLQNVLDNLGIDRTVEQLSYAEKEVARYIAILQQAGDAQGNYAKTFDSPIVQIKMLKAQLTELKETIGNFIVNAFGGIIKYALATVIAIKNVLNAIGELFGWQIETTTDDVSSVASAVGDVGDSLDDATSSAKEFKKQLMGFDEINNITSPTSSSSGSSGSSVSGIDSALLDALDEWDMKLSDISDEVEQLAQKIQDKLMSAVEWVKENWDEILEVIKAIGVALLTWKIAKTVTDFLENLGVIAKGNSFGYAFDIMLTLTGIYLMYSGLKKLLSGEISWTSIIETLAGAGMITAGIADFLRRGKYVETFKEGLQCGFGITLALAGIYLLYDSVKNILSGKIDFETIIEALAGIGLVATGVISFLKGKGYIKTLSQGIQIGFGITLALTGILGMFNGISKIISGTGDISDIIETIVAIGGTATGIYKLIKASKTGESLSTGKTVALTIGATIGITMLTTTLASGEKYYEEMLEQLYGDTASAGDIIYTYLASIGRYFSEDFCGGVLGDLINSITGNTETWEEAVTNSVDNISDHMQSILNTIYDLADSYSEATSSIYENMNAELENLEITQGVADSLSELIDSNGKVKSGYENRVDFILGELNSALGLELTRDGDLIYNNGEVVTSYEDLKNAIDDTIKAKKKEVQTEAYLELYKEDLKEQITLQRQLTDYTEKANTAYQNYLDALAEGNDELAEQYLEEYNEYVNGIKGCETELETVEQNLANDAMYAFGEISASAIENGTLTRGALIGAVEDIPEQWEEAYSAMESSTKNTMLAMSTTIDNYSGTIEEKWKELAEDSVDDFNEAISQVEPDVQAVILASVSTVENSNDLVEAWQNLADQSEENFATAISEVETDTAQAILQSITQTNGLSDSMVTALSTLASTSETEYNRILNGLDDDTKTAIEDAVGEVSKKNTDANKSGTSLADNIISGLTGGLIKGKTDVSKSADEVSATASNISVDGNSIGYNITSGISSGMTSSSAMTFLQSKISSLTSSITTKFKSLLGIASPSKVMADLAQYLPLGIAKGIDDNADTAINSIEDLAQNITDSFDNIELPDILSEGIKVDESAFKVDINGALDYRDITGQIQSQFEVSVNNDIADKIAQASYSAFVKAMQDEGVNVNIEAKTDEGTIVKKVSDGVEDYVRKTGKMPFPVVIG